MANITRRDFFKVGAGIAAAGGLSLLWKPGLRWVQGEALPQAASGQESFVTTVCALCPSGCGLNVRVVDGRAVKVEGNPLHPLNQGTCCPKGQASLEMLYSPERLQGPVRRRGPKGQAATQASDWESISWDEALALVAGQLRDLRQRGEPHTVAFLYSEARGQMRPLIEHFLAAYGSPNAISAESLDVQAARLASYFTQGINDLPVYDVDNCRYLLSFGGSFLEASRHLQRNIAGNGFMRRGQPNRGKVVVANPRMNVSASKADEWLPIRPGTYGALALGMANVIINSELYDQEFVDNFTFGFEDFTDEQGHPHQGFKSLVLNEYTLDRVEAITGVAGSTIARLAGEFATNRPAIAMLPTSFGALASGNGLYTAMAVHALNALVGSLDIKGGIQTQRYVQPADWPALAADPAADAVAEAGLAQERLDGAGTLYPLAPSAYQAVGERILAGEPYPVNALFLYNANPVANAPQGQCFAEAFGKVPLVVSFSPLIDDSAAYADLILPASTFLEVWQDDCIEGTGYPGVALRQPVVGPLYDTRNAGDVLLQLAEQVGDPLAAALPWARFEDLLQFRLSTLQMPWDELQQKGVWSQLVYFYAEPGSAAWAEVVGRDRLLAPKDGRFDFFSRELFSALSPADDLACLPHFDVPLGAGDSQAYPLLLVSEELMTQPRGWGGVIPTLQEVYGMQTQERWKSWVEINPQAARPLGIADGDSVWVESAAGKVLVKARLYEGLWPSAVHIPYGQGHFSEAQWGRFRQSADLTIGANPYRIVAAETEGLDGLVAVSPTRVRVYKA
jgi:anaerobic selenocysteine-containing dehydrogenase